MPWDRPRLRGAGGEDGPGPDADDQGTRDRVLAEGLARPPAARCARGPRLRRRRALAGPAAQAPRTWILYTEETPHLPVHSRLTLAEAREAIAAGAEPTYSGTFVGARKYVLDTFANTKSAAMKRRVAEFLTAGPCPVCRRQEAQTRSPVRDDRRARYRRILRSSAARTHDRPQRGRRRGQGIIGRSSRGRSSDHGRFLRGEAGDDGPPRQRVSSTDCDPSAISDSDTSRSIGPPRRCPEGEFLRLRLATQLTSELFGVVYVLDEPSAGLHPQDVDASCRHPRRAEGAQQQSLRRRTFRRHHAARRLARRHRTRGRPTRRRRPLQRPPRPVSPRSRTP